ncbi:MAG: glucodextranase DOMON-like domain-containing protein [Candidatus Riflebacteria bacterium]|nr:glucodextranase DOMON-like domain-containing protein [Candidatus Riflebacteria bacterium]
MKTPAARLLHILACCAVMLFIAVVDAAAEPVNYYYETGSWLDVTDPVGDDKGPGYYLYPSDKRMRRGTFDIKRFTVYEEGQVVVFEIQMRNYIMREWPNTARSENQGFVANLWDIYIDIDGIAESGYKQALPGRDLLFADNMGWEKVVMVSPLGEYELYDILRDKTDELEFQNQIDDIIYPDYVKVQRDKVIIKISKLKLPRISEKSGYQCLAMGYQKIVSPNRLLNRDVRAFASFDDFGGGHDTYGDSPTIDMIVPEGDDQYAILRDYRSEPYRENITYAEVPFVYKGGLRQSPAMAAINRQIPTEQQSSSPAVKQAQPVQSTQPVIRVSPGDSSDLLASPPPVVKQTGNASAQPVGKTPVKIAPKNSQSTSGFVPLKPQTSESGFKPMPKAPDGFIPVKKPK